MVNYYIFIRINVKYQQYMHCTARIMLLIMIHINKGLGNYMNNFMMTSSNGNIFPVTVPLCGEFTGHQWIPLTKASDAELWRFIWPVPEQTLSK